jgi:alpha-tubulin suppressor-like RCC1 family protein
VNGTVVGWGKAYSGAALPPPASATNVVAIAAGGDHNLAIRSNGTLVAWGENNLYGRLTVPASATNILAIACGNYFSLALRRDGKVVAWGDNGAGQTNVPVSLTNVVDVAGGSYFSLALQATDGPPLLGRPFVPPAIAGTKGVLRIKAISSTPVSYQWTSFGTNLPGATNASLILPNTQFNQAGSYSVIVSNAFGVVTNSDMMLGIVPVLLTVIPETQTALVGANVQLAVTAAGQSPLTYQWRLNGTNLGGITNSLTLTNVQPTDAGAYSVAVSNTFGGVVSPDAILNVVPTLTTTPLQSRSTFPGGTATFSLIVQANIPVSYQWQFNGTNLPGATSNSLTLTNVQYAQAGIYSVILSNAFEVQTNNATLAVSLVAGWGSNRSGQLVVPALTNVVSIASGGDHGLALKSDGLVTAWGSHSFGQTNVPPDLTNVMAIAGGGLHSLALKRDGTVTAWGSNEYGQTNPPPGLAGVVAIAAGNRHSLALKADGTLIAWGYDGAGLTNFPANLTNIVAIAAGYAFNLILKADGTVLAWGSNNSGQTNTPSNLTNVVGISAGGFHGTATTSDGRIVSWGKYAGSGTTYTPSGLSNAAAISDGWESSMALTDDGTVVAWGRNSWGQTNVPAGLTNVVAIAAGYYHNFALINEGPLIASVVPVNPVWSHNVFSVSVPSQSSLVYRLEYKDSLLESNWTALPLVAGNGSVLTLTDTAATNSQRFYRVRQW